MHDKRRHISAWHSAGIVLLFAIVGPLVGAIGVNLVLSGIAAASALAAGNLAEVPKLLIGGMLVGTIVSLPIAYSFGLPAAVSCGIVAALTVRRSGSIRIGPVLTTAAISLVAVLVVLALMVELSALAAWAASLFLGHVLGVAICVSIGRRLT
jgi:hypothetical protein